jgi:hypothetical protein
MVESQNYLNALFELLKKRLSDDELQTLYFFLGLNYSDLQTTHGPASSVS